MKIKISVLFTNGARETYKQKTNEPDKELEFIESVVKDFYRTNDPQKAGWFKIGDNIVDLSKTARVSATLSFF